MTVPTTDRLVLGSGPVARVLGFILRRPVVSRRTDDSGWNWPELKPANERQLLLVSPPFAGASQVIRWHGQAWGCPSTQDLSCVLFGLAEDAIRDLARRDVFGRLGAGESSSFDEWSNYVGIVPESSSLAALREQMTALIACPVETWRAHAQKASVAPELGRAISDHDFAGLAKIAPAAAQQDWDAVCPHSDANQIRRVLAAVTSGVTPDWEQASSVLASLKRGA